MFDLRIAQARLLLRATGPIVLGTALLLLAVIGLATYEYFFVHRYVIAIDQGSYSGNSGLLEIGTTKAVVQRHLGLPDKTGIFGPDSNGYVDRPYATEEWSYHSWDGSTFAAVFYETGDTVVRILHFKNHNAPPRHGFFF